jgi:hypothetical protein
MRQAGFRPARGDDFGIAPSEEWRNDERPKGAKSSRTFAAGGYVGPSNGVRRPPILAKRSDEPARGIYKAKQRKSREAITLLFIGGWTY